MELYATAENPSPDGAVCAAVPTGGGCYLRTMYAVGPAPRGTVVVLGGRGDFMERYFETMRELMARGFAVATLDLRGQGGSTRLLEDKRRGHVRSFGEFEEDLEVFMTHVVMPNCPQPYYALGHSTGGAIVLGGLRHHVFRKAVVLAPLIGLLYGNWPRPAVWFLVAFTNLFGLGWLFLPGQGRLPLRREDFPGNPLTGDRRRWMRDQDTLDFAPQLGIGGPTFAWLRAARKATARLRAMGRRDPLPCPVLVVVAGLDRVVDNRAIRRFAARVPGVSLVTIREALHEILSERDEVRQQFWAMFDAFIGDDPPPAAGRPARLPFRIDA